jgi:hypothetical protein
MTNVVIRQHLWKNGGEVGIAHYIHDDITVKIESLDKDKNLIYPNKYRLPKNKLMSYKVEQIGKGVPVRCVPIRDMTEVTFNLDQFEGEDKRRLILIKELFNVKEEHMDFDLSNYKPEKVKDNDFEVMTGKGYVCQVNSAKIEDVPAGENDRGSYEGYTRLRYELEIISEKNKGRRLWKSYNLSSKEKTGKAEKTPVEKLADAFFTIGLEFGNQEQLEACIEKFADMELIVSCSKFKPKGGEVLQLHTITGVASGEAVAAAPSAETVKSEF